MPAEPLVEPWTLAFPYTRSTGPVLGRFFAGLALGRILGTRTRKGRVLVPPLEYDPDTGEALSEWVEVSPVGTVESYTWIAEPHANHPRRRPFAFVLVRLDGAHTGLAHILDAESEAAVHVGLRVQALFTSSHGHILDLAGFVPGEREFVAGVADLPALASSSFVFPMALRYDVRAGFAMSVHLRALAEGRFVGMGCPRCGRVYIPPLGACSVCAIAVTESVELPQHGVVTTSCIVSLRVRGQEHLPRPFACVNVLLDGADTPFLTLLQGAPVAEVRRGMAVRAVWADEKVPSLASVKHFTPTGEFVDLAEVIAARRAVHRV